MRRALGKGLDALARALFAAMRAIAAVTGRSLSVSLLILMALLAVVAIGLWRWMGAAALLVTHAPVLVAMVRMTTLVKAYDDAFGARDFAEVIRIREIIEGKGEPRSAATRAMKNVGDAELLLEFEKWAEAADVFATIELGDLPERARPGILSELGYARAHAGKVDRGVDDIERALEQADAQTDYPVGKRFHLLRRHGIALSLAGEHERAIEIIAPLREYFQGSQREWAEAFYFLGRSHAARGERDLAGGAFASAVFGQGPFVARAWKELEAITDPAELALLREEVAKGREKKN